MNVKIHLKHCIFLTVALSVFGVVCSAKTVDICGAPKQVKFYVSPGGDDLNVGSEMEPFQTIERARDAVRAINGTMTSDILVILEGGEYPISSTIQFNELDSGQNGRYVIYCAKTGETPLLTGGVKVKGWTPVSGTNLYKAKVTEVENFRQMYVNGSRAQRAVSSKTFEGKDWHYDHSGVEDGLILEMSSVPASKNQGDIELVQVSNWSFHRVPVNRFVETGTGEIAILMRQPYFAWSLKSTGHNRFSFKKPFYIENAYELLDTPGEWYFDRVADTLYYWPLPEEDMFNAEVYIPKTETLVQIRGKSLTKKVENIRFDGLTFAHTTELRASRKGSFTQQASKWSDGDGGFAMTESSDYRPKAAVFLEATFGIEFRNNVFKHFGGAGLDGLNAVNDTLIEANLFRDISDSAIAIGDWSHIYINTGNSCRWFASSFANGSIEVDIKLVAEHEGASEMGVAKFVNSGNHVKFYHHDHRWKIAKVIAGETTILDLGSVYPVSENEVYSVRFVVDDSAIEGFVNGVSQCRVSDSELDKIRETSTFALIADNAKVRFDQVQMVDTDSGAVINEDFEGDPFPNWFNLGNWETVSDGSNWIQFDDVGVLDDEVCTRTWIKHNIIEQTAREYWGACAVSAYITDGLVIENNRIHDTKYSGITLGWGHGNYPGSSTCVNSVVRFNDISNFNYQCYDGGAIYTTGQMPETLIAYNYLHDSLSDHPLRGIQNDNGSGAIEIKFNVVENVKYPDGEDQRWLQYTKHQCFDIFAHNNFTNSTEQRNRGGDDCSIVDTTRYENENRPEMAYAIANKTGVMVPAVFTENFDAGADAWTANQGEWSIVSNSVEEDRGYQVNAKAGASYSVTAHRYVNATVEAKIRVEKRYAKDSCIGVVARYLDEKNVYRFFHNKDSWKLIKRVNGTATILSEGKDSSLDIGCEVDVKFVVNGSTLEGYVNGILQCRASDTDLVAGKTGLYTFKSKGTFDDVSIRVNDSELPETLNENTL